MNDTPAMFRPHRLYTACVLSDGDKDPPTEQFFYHYLANLGLVNVVLKGDGRDLSGVGLYEGRGGEIAVHPHIEIREL